MPTVRFGSETVGVAGLPVTAGPYPASAKWFPANSDVDDGPLLTDDDITTGAKSNNTLSLRSCGVRPSNTPEIIPLGSIINRVTIFIGPSVQTTPPDGDIVRIKTGDQINVFSQLTANPTVLREHGPILTGPYPADADSNGVAALLQELTLDLTFNSTGQTWTVANIFQETFGIYLPATLVHATFVNIAAMGIEVDFTIPVTATGTGGGRLKSTYVLGDKKQTDRVTLLNAVASLQRKLDDEDAEVWSVEELELYIQDGYDQFCRRTKCLYDIFVIENRPNIGNWTDALGYYLATQSPGMHLTDEPIHMTRASEQYNNPGGVGQSLSPPAQITERQGAVNPIPGFDLLENTVDPFEHFGISKETIGPRHLPPSVVEIVRITWDEYELVPEGSMSARKYDELYEHREGGDPQFYTIDKDGLLAVRLSPPPRGDADYPIFVGTESNPLCNGFEVYNETDDRVNGLLDPDTTPPDHGILRDIDGIFPSGGPDGMAVQFHPALKNTMVEVFRLGRPLMSAPFEIPRSAVKFIVFFAAGRALSRRGPGQDAQLAEHFFGRYEMGVKRTEVKLRTISRELVLKMGAFGARPEGISIGDPQLPSNYGPATGRIRQE